MPNPSADYPTAVHTPVDLSGFGGQALGATTPKQTEIIGKLEQEIVALQQKLGIGSAPASGASTNYVLTKRANGTTGWEPSSGGGGGSILVINVLDYGAVGDGTTDDTTAVQEAIADALDTANIGHASVYFPRGKYRVTETLDCTAASGSVDGNGVYLVGEGINASQIIKDHTGVGIAWNGSGGPDGNPSRYGGLYNITIDCDGNAGKALQTNSAQQMVWDRFKVQNCADTALDMDTTQDSWFGKVMFNNCEHATNYVIEIYGSADGTSNMLWWADLRVETFIAGALRLKQGSGQVNKNNGIYIDRFKPETINAGGDLVSIDNMNEDVVIDTLFSSATGFHPSYVSEEPVNIIYSRAVNKVSFNKIYVNSADGVVDAAIDIQCQNGIVHIGDIFMTGDAPVTSVVVCNGNSFDSMFTVGLIETTQFDPAVWFAYEGTANTDNIFHTVSQIGAKFLSDVSILGRLKDSRIQKRTTVTNAPGATPSIDTDTTDVARFTGLATAITSLTTNLTGTPEDGDELWVSFKDDGTARAITHGASFASSGVAALLTTTVINKTMTEKFMYDAALAKWVLFAVDATGY